MALSAGKNSSRHCRLHRARTCPALTLKLSGRLACTNTTEIFALPGCSLSVNWLRQYKTYVHSGVSVRGDIIFLLLSVSLLCHPSIHQCSSSCWVNDSSGRPCCRWPRFEGKPSCRLSCATMSECWNAAGCRVCCGSSSGCLSHVSSPLLPFLESLGIPSSSSPQTSKWRRWVLSHTNVITSSSSEETVWSGSSLFGCMGSKWSSALPDFFFLFLSGSSFLSLHVSIVFALCLSRNRSPALTATTLLAPCASGSVVLPSFQPGPPYDDHSFVSTCIRWRIHGSFSVRMRTWPSHGSDRRSDRHSDRNWKRSSPCEGLGTVAVGLCPLPHESDSFHLLSRFCCNLDVWRNSSRWWIVLAVVLRSLLSPTAFDVVLVLQSHNTTSKSIPASLRVNMASCCSIVQCFTHTSRPPRPASDCVHREHRGFFTSSYLFFFLNFYLATRIWLSEKN